MPTVGELIHFADTEGNEAVFIQYVPARAKELTGDRQGLVMLSLWRKLLCQGFAQKFGRKELSA